MRFAILAVSVLAVAGAAKVDFVREVQPIFRASCESCHGSKMQLGGLRLDARQTALAVIKPGDTAGSLLLKRINGLGDQPRMPMSGKPLAPEQIRILEHWIEQGADWPESASAPTAEVKRHWAFVPPVRPTVPSVARKGWTRTPVDAFIAQRLEQEKLAPSAPADRITLLRRLSLDLTGLPPAIDDVDAFVKDRSPDAYRKQVDRLLASPHYGERWGRIWLDAARYADSNGFEKDKPREVWFYRDWVIHALNRDLPYDRFVIEQIAGDLLPNPTQDQLVATGFLRNSMLNEEGGVDPEQFRMEAMFDRMDAVGKGVLGITIQCAQCHNHKFDPLTQEEYYRMFAFLNDSYEANAAVYSPPEQMKLAEIRRRTHEIEADLQHRFPDWRERMARWEASAKQDQPAWTVLRPTVDDISTGGERYLPQPDGSFVALGFAPPRKTVKMTVASPLPRITAFRLELLRHPDLPRGGPGRSLTGMGALTEFGVETEQKKKLKFAGATADYSMPPSDLPASYDPPPPADSTKKDAKPRKPLVLGPVDFAIDGDTSTAWGIDAGPGFRNQSRKAVFTPATPIENAAGMALTFHLNQSHGGASDSVYNLNLGCVRLSATSSENAVADPLPQKVRDILDLAPERRTPAQVQALFAYWRSTVLEWKTANDEIAALWRDYPEGHSQFVLEKREMPRATHILTRGDFLQPAQPVTPGVPAFLHPLPKDAVPDRLTFARWLVDRKSPTTARSMVNRIWQAYFGTGLVSSAENFGTQADLPSHPELLDWLAVEFMDHGWSLKHLHRLIVMSATYQQSSNVSPELLARDPDNRLLARGPRLRVDAEIVRDITLASSGLLSPSVGGPSVFPPIPTFLLSPPASYAPKNWEESTGPERYRRAVYTFRYRSLPYPMLQAFDAPNGDFSCVRRSRSNTPLQALTTLNEPLFMEAAQALAARTLKQGGSSDNSKLHFAFRLCVARPPSADEAATLQGFLVKQQQRFPHDPARVWTALARVLLNLDETITKE